MSRQPTVQREWADKPLYQFLLATFPEHRGPYRTLNVKQLHAELGRSHEAVYKWIRSSKLTPENARALMDLANKPENQEARRKAGNPNILVTIRDFDGFVYAA